jgi:hypothetical protein
MEIIRIEVLWHVMMCYCMSFYVFDCLTLKMKALHSFKMSGTAYVMIQCHIPEDFKAQQDHYENLRLHVQVLPAGEMNSTVRRHSDG